MGSAIFDPRPEDPTAGLRVPPHSVEAEHSVLGALLIDNRAWDRVADLLVEGDFYRPEHRAIYTAVGQLINAGKPADVVTVFDKLGDRAEQVGGLNYLNAVAQCVPSAANARRYAEIVREKAVTRNLLARITDAQEVAWGDAPLADKVEAVAALFAGVDAGSSRKKPRGMDEVIVQVIDQINAAAEGGGEVGWKTSISKIDWRLNGGLKPGKLVVLAARPSVGKTSLAGQIAKRLASDGLPTLFLSQEMEADEVGERALANQARVNYSSIQTGQLTDDEWARISEGVDALGRVPLFIDDEPALTLRAIASKARSIKGLKALVVDFVQLCEGEGDNRNQQIGSITRGLKKLAKQLGIVVIALSQLSRDVEKRPGRRPIMSDLRESGEIEQDADTVIFLWPLDESEDDLEVRHVGCDFAKNRRGKKGAFVMTFEGAKQLWQESHRSVDEFGKRGGLGRSAGGQSGGMN
jgi:replicative DNA helicase